jgi:integrase
MILAGLRVGELCALRWRDVDLASGRIVVAGAKTDAGVRKVDLLPLLAAELVGHRDGLRAGRDGVARLGRLAQDAPVFATATGKARDRHNVRERVVKRASALASERLVEAGGAPLPTLTPHALRRTFASVLVNLGRDPAYVMAQMGHTDAKLTLSLYARPMPQDEREALARLVECTNAFPHGATLRTG